MSEIASRFDKALAIADTLDAGGIGSETAALMDPRQWAMASEAARVRVPSETTRTLIVRILQRREVARAAFSSPSTKHETTLVL